jgi:hypothetical protein
MSDNNKNNDLDDWETELIGLLSRAKHMRALYKKVSHDKPPYSVDDYLELIGDYTGYEIDLKPASWESKGLIRGICLPFDGNKVSIRVPLFIDDDAEQGATKCEQRYISLKEAAHLVIDEEDAFVENCLALVEAIVFESPYASVDKLEADGRSDVFYGKIFAMELLFPVEYRGDVKAEIDAGLSTYDAAQRFMIPEKELIWFLSANVDPALKRLRKIEERLESIFLESITPGAGE